MKKTVLMFATAALAALSLSDVAGNKVSAAIGDTTTSTAKIHLDPDTTKGDGTGTIQLLSAPSFDFGKVSLIADKDTEADATGDKTLSVLNPGVAEGWAVDAKAGEFTGTAGSLRGAELSITTSTDTTTEATGVSSANISGVADDQKGPQVLGAIFGDRKNSTGYVGVGTTNSTVSAHILVPAGNVAGDYTSTITWTLAQDPSTNTPADGE